MLRQLTFLFIIVSSTFSYAKHEIRVLIDQQKNPIEFYSEFPVHFKTAVDSISISFPKATYKISKDQLIWNIEAVSLEHRQSYQLSGRKLFVNSKQIKINEENISFPLVLIKKKNKYQTIGRVEIEDYLAGVLPHEMPASWPLDALKAQAIASRSYAYWKSIEQKSNDFDVQSTIHDQVFKLNRLSGVENRVQKVLQATRGQILLNPKKEIVKAYFHSDCGGFTDSSLSIWGRNDSKSSSVRDIACSNRVRNRWSSKFSEAQILAKLKQELMIPTDIELLNIFVRTKLQSQRVEWVDIVFSKGILKRLRGEDIRRIFGYSNVRSTLFSVSKLANVWTFTGKGFGHGVGLCQWGSRSMAEAGKSYKQILLHYYPMAHLGTIDENENVLVSFLHQ